MFAKTIAPSTTGPYWIDTTGRRLASALLLGAAVFLGVSVATNQWLPVVLLLVLPLVVLWPVPVSLGSFALLIPFDGIAVLGQEKTGTTLTFVIGGAATMVLIFIAFGSKRLIPLPRAALWWTLFVAWGVASATWALDPELSWQRARTSLAFLLMFLAAVSFRITPKELSRVELCAIVGGVAAAIYSTAQFYSGTFYLGAQSMRGSMILGERQEDPNQFAVTLLLPVALALGRFFSTRNRLEKTLLLMATGTIALGLFLTMSRGVILALSVLVLFFTHKLRVGWRILIPVCILLLSCLLLPNLFFTRLQDAVSSRGAGRFDIWIAALQAVWRHGLWGAGLENFPTAYTDVAGAAPTFGGFGRSSHNMYLGMIVELGIGGFLCLAYAMRSQLHDASRARENMPRTSQCRLIAYQAACYAMLVSGLSLDIVWRKSFWLCWILLAMATSLGTKQAADGS